MLDDIPRATVVITNPTHLAIALRYDRGTMTAPGQVIAKGAGQVAQRIMDLGGDMQFPSWNASRSPRRSTKLSKLDKRSRQPCTWRLPRFLLDVYRLRGVELNPERRTGE